MNQFLNMVSQKNILFALGNAYFKEYGFASANIVLSNMYGPYDHFEEKITCTGCLNKKNI